MSEEILGQIAENVISGKAPQTKELVEQALSAGIAPEKILNEGLVAGMSVVGDRFKKNEFYVPEVLIAARAMKQGTEILTPALKESGVKARATVCVGTVKGDLHDIGKNLVCMMLEGAGFEVIDLGVNVDSQKFLEEVDKSGAQLLGLSALLTTTMGAMKTTVDAFNEAGVKDKVKIIVGGAPLTQSFADEIGADGYAPDAASAVDLANDLLGL